MDETAASLELSLQAERDHRNEERFFWIFGVSILIDVIIFRDLGVWAFPIYLLQIVLLIGLASWMGVEQVTVFLERIFHKYIPKSDGDNASS